MIRRQIIYSILFLLLVRAEGQAKDIAVESVSDWTKLEVGEEIEFRDLVDFPKVLVKGMKRNRSHCNVDWQNVSAVLMRPRKDLFVAMALCSIEEGSFAQLMIYSGGRFKPLSLSPWPNAPTLLDENGGCDECSFEARGAVVFFSTWEWCDCEPPAPNDETRDFYTFKYVLSADGTYVPFEEAQYAYEGKLRRVNWRAK